jgi:hypothetical protein
MGMRAHRARAPATLLFVGALVGGTLVGGCKSDPGPPVPASADPEGKDLVVGAVVAAFEKDGGVRLYKVKEINYFPPPLSDELVMLAFNEKGGDFPHAAKLFEQRNLTVAVPNVRVYRHLFRERDYRVLAVEPVSDADRALKAKEKLPPKG